MIIYVGMTQDLALAREYLVKIDPTMCPDIEMGPFKHIDEAIGYIEFMKERFPESREIALPHFSVSRKNTHKWYVFSFMHQDINVH